MYVVPVARITGEGQLAKLARTTGTDSDLWVDTYRIDSQLSCCSGVSTVSRSDTSSTAVAGFGQEVDSPITPARQQHKLQQGVSVRKPSSS
jgi:hypothetical protein